MMREGGKSTALAWIEDAARRRPTTAIRALAVAGLVLTGALLWATPALAVNRASNISATCATFEAEPGKAVNGSKASYYFEYITQAQYKEDHGNFGAGTMDTPESESPFSLVSTEVCGLTPRTAYRFRIVVPSPPPETIGEEAIFTTSYGYGSSHELTATFGTKASGDPVPLSGPSDVAVDQMTGDIYATDPGVDERQTITITATGGTYTLTFKGKTTAAINWNAPMPVKCSPRSKPCRRSARTLSLRRTSQTSPSLNHMAPEFLKSPSLALLQVPTLNSSPQTPSPLQAEPQRSPQP